MQHRHKPSPAELHDGHASVRGERWQTQLVRVRSGVAAGSSEQCSPSLRAESWALFRSRDQIDACCAEDPRRFSDPLPHSQLQSAFVRVLERPC
jgi:hypothetical protein